MRLTRLCPLVLLVLGGCQERDRAAPLAQALAGCPSTAAIDTHGPVCDAGGKLLSWAPVSGDRAYDYVLGLDVGYFLGRPRVTLTDASGANPVDLPPWYGTAYLCSGTSGTYSCSPAGSNPNYPTNPAGMIGMIADGAFRYAPYRGDSAMVDAVTDFLSWQLGHGMTSASDSWANVAYASGAAGQYVFQGLDWPSEPGRFDGAGFIEPEKSAAFAYALIRAWEYNGNTSFRDAAVNTANQLASHQRSSGLSNARSPWPFRVRASNDTILGGSTAASEDYASNVVDALWLLSELDTLCSGGQLAAATCGANQTAWRNAKSVALGWLLGASGPLATGLWTQYFEDVGDSTSNGNLNQLVAMETAKYLLDHPGDDANWQSHVAGLLAWVESNFKNASRSVNGANAINEQQAFFFAMGSHTSRYAAVAARYAELSGDASFREKALRSFNWASYMVRSDGLTIDGPDVLNVWFTDSWGDIVRNFMIGMGANPDWAPAGQNHLLRSTAVVRTVNNGPGNQFSYTTALPAATEVLRLAFAPASVSAGGVALLQRSDLGAEGWTLDTSPDAFGNTRNVVRVRHDHGGSVVINGAPPTAPQVAITSPSANQNLAAPAALALAATVTPSSGRTLVQVVFRAGATTLCTVDNPAAGSVACTAGASLGDGSYAIIATASDSAGESGSATQSITVAGPPSASVTAPADGATLAAGAVTLTAAVTVGSGRSPSRVEFFNGATSLCAATSGTSCTWNAVAGSYAISATVTDNGTPPLSAASSVVHVTVRAGSGVLVGDNTIESSVDFEDVSRADAFRYVAGAGGNAGAVFVYADASNQATRVIVGVYGDSGGAPGTRLGACTLTLPAAQAGWFSCALPTSPAIAAGTAYWIAALSPTGGAELRWREQGSGQYSATNTGLSDLPATWSQATTYTGSSRSAYVQAAP